MKSDPNEETIMSKRSTTFDREMKDPVFKRLFDEEYKELLLSELLYQLMTEEKQSVLGSKKTLN